MKKSIKKYSFELHLHVLFEGETLCKEFTFNFENYCFGELKDYYHCVTYFLLNNVDNSLKNCFNVDLSKVITKYVSIVFVRDCETNLFVDLF